MEDRLKKFVQLVDAGSFTRAAHTLHISQPALSVAVGKLERELGAALLVHGVRPMTLTPAGKLAYASGRELSVHTSNLSRQLAELATRETTVSVGMIDSVAGTFLGSSKGITALERNAAVSLVVDNSRNLVNAIERGDLDIAFVTSQSQYADIVEVIASEAEPLVTVCHKRQQVAVNRAVQTGCLPSFISYDEASTSHKLIVSALWRRGVTAKTAFYSTSPEVMLRLVLLKKGVSVLPYSQVRDRLMAGDVALVGKPPLLVSRRINVIKRRDMLVPTSLMRTAHHVTHVLRDVHTHVDAYVAASQ